MTEKEYMDQPDFLEVPYLLIVSYCIIFLALYPLSLNIIYCSYKETGKYFWNQV